MKFRARQKDIPFNLDEEFIRRVYEPGVCAYCAVPVVHGAADWNPRNAELDRIDPVLGYTKGNVLLACSSCNQRKNDMLPVELRLLADQIEDAVAHRVIKY